MDLTEYRMEHCAAIVQLMEAANRALKGLLMPVDKSKPVRGAWYPGVESRPRQAMERIQPKALENALLTQVMDNHHDGRKHVIRRQPAVYH